MPENDMSRKIKDLRAKHNLTLEQIAQIVGVGRSTVRKWETGQIQNMRRDKIAKLAAALHTTPEFLMGWDPSADSVAPNNNLTVEESVLISKYRCLDERGKAAVMNVLDHEYNSLPGEKADTLTKEA